jgi:creatinine amidohydrolase
MGHMTMEEFRRAIGRGLWLLVPLGTTEEHGAHLPLGTDTLIAEHVCQEVARRCEAVVAPALPYGLCRTTRNFPGTISVGFATLEAVVREVLAECVRQGARRIAVISGHAGAGHLESVRVAGQRLVEEVPDLLLLVLGPDDVPLPAPPRMPPGMADGHAGATETSVLLAIHPDRVRTDRLAPASAAPFPPGRVFAHPEEAFPSGVIGDPTRASAQAGVAVLDQVVPVIVEMLAHATVSASHRPV